MCLNAGEQPRPGTPGGLGMGLSEGNHSTCRSSVKMVETAEMAEMAKMAKMAEMAEHAVASLHKGGYVLPRMAD